MRAPQPLLPVVVTRDAARRAARPLGPARYGVAPDALDSAIAWLVRTHEVTGRRGSSKGYSLLFGWYPAFPETTGYVIGTLLEYAERRSRPELVDHARQMGHWEIEVQAEDGGIMEGLVGEGKGSIAFNTGMVLHGWVDLHERLGDPEWLAAGERAGRFLVETQSDDGAWRGEHAYNGIPHTYKSRVAWAMIRLADVTGDDGYRAAARRNLDWVLGQQRENGWFDCCNFAEGALPNTHAMAYTMRGLVESHALLDHEPYLAAAVRMSEVLIRKLEVLGTLPATFDGSWNPQARYVCLTGVVQLGGVWLRLHQLTGDARFLNAGLKAVDLAAAHQERLGTRDSRGALPGSFPVWGRYAPMQYPNWATKFLADSLMLREECAPA